MNLHLGTIQLRRVVTTVAILSSVTLLRAQPLPYTVADGRVTSAMQPAIRLDVDTALKYVGSQRWILYNVAQAEQHLFVQKSASGVDRFLWIQFEEYIPSSNGKYDYSSNSPISAFGRELRVSRELWNMPTVEARPQSDGAYARKMLREHGITLPAQMLYERFIYLPDASGRRELMVIYAENAQQYKTASLPKEKIDALLNDHERRALKSFAIGAATR